MHQRGEVGASPFSFKAEEAEDPFMAEYILVQYLNDMYVRVCVCIYIYICIYTYMYVMF